MPDKNIRYIIVKRWYLEMTEKPTNLNLIFPRGTELKSFEGDASEYRKLNKLVGSDLGWVDRQIMPDIELEQLIKKPETEIYLLHFEQELVGFSELVRYKENIVELKYFGLVPNARGKGLGKFFLHWTIDKAWQYQPTKFILNTCEIDHPSALPIYLKAGFKIVDERMEQQAVLVNG